MQIEKYSKYNKAMERANRIAESRGYFSYSDIDDPFLREWIWNECKDGIKFSYKLIFTPVELITPAIIIILLFILLLLFF